VGDLRLYTSGNALGLVAATLNLVGSSCCRNRATQSELRSAGAMRGVIESVRRASNRPPQHRLPI
jgi:hypothetical protein